MLDSLNSNSIRIVILSGVFTLLGACATTESSGPITQGDDFNSVLAREYVSMAQQEAAENDRDDSEFFMERANQASSGAAPAPQSPGQRNLSAADNVTATEFYNRLTSALTEKKDSKPTISALAQASFECWIQELEENIQQADINDCRRVLQMTLRQLEASEGQMPVPVEAVATDHEEAEHAELPGNLVVLFELESAILSEKRITAIRTAVTTAQNAKVKRIEISGHTDRSGSDIFNDKLSLKRARAVADVVEDSITGSIELLVKGYGEKRPRINTADGILEPKNRRVEISFRH